MESLRTDAFTEHDFSSMRNDVYHHITTSGHIMSQGGPICQDWTKVSGTGFPVLSMSMGWLTGNTLMGSGNIFNQYWLCKLKKFRITFKDIVVNLETSTTIGLQTMSDVVTEWRRRPQGSLFGGNPIVPPETQYPDWWGDWRPATDGAVTFEFQYNGRETPAWIANAVKYGTDTSTAYRDPTNYRSLGLYSYGSAHPVEWTNDADLLQHGGDTERIRWHQPYTLGDPRFWMDYFFEWRARNCPNAQSSANTSAAYNIQIDADWDLSYRMTDQHFGRYEII